MTRGNEQMTFKNQIKSKQRFNKLKLETLE